MKKTHKCEGEKVYKLNFYRTGPCPNNASISRDGHWYCKIHDPIAKEIRQNKNTERKENTLKDKLAQHIAYLKIKQLNAK